jgi:hypothetical protein
MTEFEKIAEAIRRLPPAELARLRDWFFEFDADEWDRQIAEDVAAGRLDDLAAEAIEDYRAGRTREL